MGTLSQKPVLDWILKKVTSKKLWAFVGTASVTALAAYSGQIPWAIAVPALINTFLIYAGVEGGVDIVRAISGAINGGRNRIVYDPAVLNPYDVESDNPNDPIRVRRSHYGINIPKSGAITTLGEAAKKGQKK